MKITTSVPGRYQERTVERMAYRAGYRAGFRGGLNLAVLRGGDAIKAYEAGFEKGQQQREARTAQAEAENEVVA